MFNLKEMFSDLLETELSDVELQFQTEDGKKVFGITGLYKGKCDCCDTKIITFVGSKL